MIPLLATLICAVIAGQTIWILKLYGRIEEMERTWRPRNDAGPLPPMPWPPADAAAAQALASVPAQPEDDINPEWNCPPHVEPFIWEMETGIRQFREVGKVTPPAGAAIESDEYIEAVPA